MQCGSAILGSVAFLQGQLSDYGIYSAHKALWTECQIRTTLMRESSVVIKKSYSQKVLTYHSLFFHGQKKTFMWAEGEEQEGLSPPFCSLRRLRNSLSSD